MELKLNTGKATSAMFSNDPLSDDDDDSESERDSTGEFDYPDDEHDNTPAEKRRVQIILRDAHDTEGKGMTIEMLWQTKFKIVFAHFKTRSCKTCRAADEMRFKNSTATVTDNDSPETLDLWHGTTTEIKVWSSVEGLQCASCQQSGYPSTNGVDKLLYKRSAPPVDPKATKPETISLRVADQTGFEMMVKMINTVGFAYLMDQYAVMAVRERIQCRFLVDGERLTPTETPKGLDMESGEKVEVFFEQIGGCQ